MRKTLPIFVMVFCLTISSLAQTKHGSLSGHVYTTEGQPAQDVTVVLKNTTRGAVTAADGSFQIRRIPPGEYIAEISLVGFSTLTEPVRIRSGQNREVDFRLSLSASELSEVIIQTPVNRYKADIPSRTLRVQTPILQLPQNIQVITENTLSDQQLFDMSEGVTRNVSGASSGVNDAWGNYANIVMRGGAVTPLRNGMNVKMPWGPLLEDMSMVDRIEFVKGPAGFMLSNADPTGLYNVVTKKPTGVNKGAVGFTLGSFDTYRTTLDLDGKLSGDGKLLYRFNLMGQLKNSHREFDFNNRYTIVPVLTYRFNDKTSVTAEYTLQHMKTALLGSGYLFSLRLGDLPRRMSLLEANMEPTTISDQSVFITFDHQIDPRWKFTTQLAYLNYQQTGSSIWPAYPAGLQPNGDLVRSIANWDAFNESRLGQAYITGSARTGAFSHRLLAGLDMTYKDYYADFYQSKSISGYNGFGMPVPFNIYNPVHGLIPAAELPVFDRSLPLSQRGGGTLGESSTSLYAQDEVSLLDDKLRITLAGRLTKLKQESFQVFSEDKAFTPRFGISYSIDRTTSVYGLYDQTFVAQQGTDSAGKPFVPVTGNSLEAGIKKEWFGSRWVSSFSIYSITRNNVITLVPGPGYKPVQTGQTRVRGAEVDIRGDITNNFSIVMNYAFTEGEISKDEDKNAVGGDIPGPGFPKHTSNAWLSYKIGGGKWKGFGASAGYQFMGARQYDNADYFRVDGNIYWQGEKIRVGLNANNILDRYLYAGAPYEYNNDFSSTEYYFQAEAGINFRLGIDYRF